MKFFAGIITAGLLASQVGALGAAEPAPSAKQAPGKPSTATVDLPPAPAEIVPAAAFYDEDAAPPINADDVVGVEPAELPPAPPAAVPTFNPVYQGAAQVDRNTFFQMMLGTYGGENPGLENGFLSIEGRGGLFGNGGNNLFFIDTRLLLNDFSQAGANLGGGFRRYLAGPDLIFGANVYYDRWDAEHGTYEQVGAGAEILGNDWSLRSNVYAPTGDRTNRFGPSIGSVVGNAVFATQSFQTSLTGVDLEYGQVLLSDENFDFSGFIGSYYYTGEGSNHAAGVRGRLELALANFTNLNISVQNDAIFDTTVMFGAEINLFDRTPNRQRGATYSRMTERVRRQMNVATAEFSETQDTGVQAFFVQGAPPAIAPFSIGPGPSGTQDDPLTVAELLASPDFGENDIAFLMNQDGPIVGNILIDSQGQRIIGAPDASGVASTILDDGTILTVDGLGGRSTLDGSLTFQTSGIASGFDINTDTQAGLVIDGLAEEDLVIVEQMNILNSAGNKIQVQNSSGAFIFAAGSYLEAVFNEDFDTLVTGTGGEVSGNTGAGLNIVDSDGLIGIAGVNFDVDEYGIRATNFNGSLVGIGETVIDNPVFGGIYLGNSEAFLQFEELTINGGGSAIYLDNFNGQFAALEANFNDQTTFGIVQENANTESDFYFGSLNMMNSANNGYAVLLNGHNGDFFVENEMVIDNTGGTGPSIGIFSQNSTTDFEFGSLEINDSGSAIVLENHSGIFNSDGLVKLDNTRAFGFHVNGGATSFDLGSLEIVDTDSNSGIGVALTDNDGDFIVQGDATITGQRIGGILSQGSSTGDFSFGSLDITPQSALQGYGVALEGHNGDFNVDGDAKITGGQWGLQARNSTGDFTFGSFETSNNSAFGVALDDHNGDFTVDGEMRIVDPWQRGFLIDGSTTDVQLGSLFVNNPAQYAVAHNNTSGSFIVDGDVDLENVGDFGFISNGFAGGGEVAFGSLDITGRPFNTGVYNGTLAGFVVENGSGNVTVDGDVNISDAQTNMLIQNRTGDLSFGSITTSNTVGPAQFGATNSGVVFNNITGDINVTEDVIVQNAGVDVGWQVVGTGVSVRNTTGSVNFGNVEIDGQGSIGFDYGNNNGGLTINGQAGPPATAGGIDIEGFAIGLSADNNTGDILLGSVDIDGVGFYPNPWSPANGMIINNNNGNFTVVGDTDINNTGNYGISLQNITGDVGFGNVTVEDTTQAGLNVLNVTGAMNVNGDLNLTDTGTFGLAIQNLDGNATITGDVNIDGATGTGINITDGPASFTVEGDTVVENTHQGIQVINTTTDLNFNNLTIEDTTGTGLSTFFSTTHVNVTGDANFTNTGSSAVLSDGISSGSFTFNNLYVDTNSASGVSLNFFTGDFTVTGDAVFEDAGGIAFLSQGRSIGDYSFNNLDISGSWTTGIGLVDQRGDFTVTGDASIDGGATGLLIQQGIGNVEFADLDITGVWGNGISMHQGTRSFTADTVDITSPGANGLIIQDTSSVIDIATLNVSNPTANGVTMSLFSGDLTISGGTISGIQSGQQGIFRHDSGSNSSITLEEMIFTTDQNDVFGMVTLEHGNGGTVTLNNNQVNFANGSTGTIGYRFGSFNAGNNLDLFGTGNTVTNAIEDSFLDTLPGTFDGSVEINSTPVPSVP